MEDLLYDFTTSDGFVKKESGSTILHAEGKIFGQKFNIPQKVYTFRTHNAFTMDDFFVIEYKSLGLRRQLSIREPFVFAINGEIKEPLACYDDILMDNKRHSLIIKTNQKSYDGIEIHFSIDRRTKADFTIYKMYTCVADELPVCCNNLLRETSYDFKEIDISNMYNGVCEPLKENVIIDGGRFFDKEKVNLFGVPFKINPSGFNMIVPPPSPKENDEKILNFGVPAIRRQCRAISRESLNEIFVNDKISELYFILNLTGVRHQRWGFASDGTILGTAGGDVTSPLFVNDVEGYMVEIVYQDGRIDTALPYNLNTKRHGIQGDVSVYAVPADGSMVEKVIFHNRKLDTDISLIAVTVNNTEDRLLPEMLIPDAATPIKHIVSTERVLEMSGGNLVINNGAISLIVNYTDGLKLIEMKNEFVPSFKIKPDYMLKIRDADNNLTINFKLLEAFIEDNKACISYQYESVIITVCFKCEDKNYIKSTVKLENKDEFTFQAGVIFPYINGAEHATQEDAWYFFPKLQNINSNETVFIYEESAPSFPMQFMDIYSPQEQGGLSLTTEERDTIVRKYALEKDENGISFYVEYPEMYGNLKPGEIMLGSPTVLAAHEGDWRKSYEIYKKWLDSWYEPYKCQNKQWYRECFWLLAEIRDFFESTEFTKSPIWYDKEKKEFNFRNVLDEQKVLSGNYPDILHLWGWTIFEEGQSIQYGNFGTTDYDYYGGREAFKNALHDVKENLGIQVSLYLHPTLLTDCYPHAAKFYPTHRVINETGSYISYGKHTYRMCHANDEWRKHAISMYQRIYKDLGIPLLYVDEFSLRVENRCYSDKHGHQVPSNLLKTDRDFITALKDIMPEEVVLYGEYEAVDINARYIDCNISYYIIDAVMDMVETSWRAYDGDDRLSNVLTNMYKFAFPKIVQLVLPMAMRNLSWHPQKFIFFNGEAIYDSFWDLEESRGEEFTRNAYRIKKQYVDCFTSDNPVSMIDTLSPAICANYFPGKNREVYTIYNRAYTTYRGSVLKIKHIEGTKYYDAWNEKEIAATVVNGYAEIPLEIHAMQMGCVVAEH